MNYEQMAALIRQRSLGNGLYGGGVPNDTNGIMPLGSGFAGQQLPQPQMQQAQYPAPSMPLGSGMYGAGPEAQGGGSFDLGSGLYGQQMPDAQATQPEQGLPQQGGQPQQAAPQGAQQSLQDVFSNPGFLMGLSLMAGKHSLNPWEGVANTGLAIAGQATRSKQQAAEQASKEAAARAEQQRIALEGQRVGHDEQRLGYEGQRVGFEGQRVGQDEQRLGLEGLRTGYEGQRVGYEGQRVAQDQQQFDENAPLRAATIQHMQGQAANMPLQGQLYGAQAAHLNAEAALEQQKQQLELAKWGRQSQFMDSAAQMLGGSSPPQGGMQQQSLPAGPTGKYGTPNALLDGLMHVESSGNPNAVNPESGATGAFQFMPSTVQMLADKGLHFDPKNPAESRDAADYYLQMLQKQNGGDLNQTLANYGGFKTKDPSQYINKVMTAANNTQPQAAPQPKTVDPMSLGKAGAMAALGGVPGGQQMLELGKMMQPQNVPAGGFQYDPQSKQYQFLPDKYKEISSTNESAKTAQELQGAATKRAEVQANDTKSMSSITNSMQRLSNTADELSKHEGLKYNTGKLGAIPGVNNILVNPKGADAKVQLENLKSKMVIEAMTTLKSASATGSTGFGQLSEQENQRLENYVSNLNKAQTMDSMQKALGDIKDFADSSLKAHQERYNSLYTEGKPGVSANGPAPEANAAAGAKPEVARAAPGAPTAAAPAGGAMSLDDYLKSKRPKTAAGGSRESSGKIKY